MKGSIEQFWYRPSVMRWLFLPLHLLLYLLVVTRRSLYSLGFKKVRKPNAKVIVVGNITVGGTGKTPFIVWLSEYLLSKDKSIAIISRGYGGTSPSYPLEVTASIPVQQAGDEPKLLSERLNVPIIVDPDRVRAAFYAEQKYQPDYIISDDGLQHYALGRDFEICIIDGLRKLGNEFLMPVGPLREPKSRLTSCNLILQNGGDEWLENRFEVQPLFWVNLQDGEKIDLRTAKLPFDRCNAICGIGNPEKFSRTLQQQNLRFDLTVYPDHHKFNESDFESFSDSPLIMTEKDAIKCRAFAKSNWWYLTIGIEPNSSAITAIDDFIESK